MAQVRDYGGLQLSGWQSMNRKRSPSGPHPALSRRERGIWGWLRNHRLSPEADRLRPPLVPCYGIRWRQTAGIGHQSFEEKTSGQPRR